MDIAGLLKSFFGAVGSIFGYASKRADLNNAPDVKKAKEAQQEVSRTSDIESAVANRDTQSVRNILAE